MGAPTTNGFAISSQPSIFLTSVPIHPHKSINYHRSRSKFPLSKKWKVTSTISNVVRAPDSKLSYTTLNLKLLITVKLKKTTTIQDILSRFLHQEGSIILQLVSQDIDPETNKAKLSEEGVLKQSPNIQSSEDHLTYQLNLNIASDFGIPGAIIVSNRYEQELFLTNVSVEGAGHIGTIQFTCRSWIPALKTRVFFCDKPYLPCETPAGLVELRKREMKDLQGDGKGIRLGSDRIYDYDVYNDLGKPDKGPQYSRPTLGGRNSSYPYPRRCRTGRPPTTTDKEAESPPSSQLPQYVPRDEEYEDEKWEFMSQGTTKAVLRNIIPILLNIIFGQDSLYLAVVGNQTRIVSLDKQLNGNPCLNILRGLDEAIEHWFKLDPPKYISENLTWGLPDDEFGRRVLASLNPLNIEKLKVFPPVSKLDPSVYGPQESALREEHITRYLEGISVDQAMAEDRLFILDYYDIYLPFVNRINALEGCKTYATRSIFFLTPSGVLKPIAIELTLPTTDNRITSKQVLTPPTDGSTDWLWELGKEHVCSNDAAVHTLINHWLRIHACTEPFIIAAHRNMSVMHPIFKLLRPHMRYLMRTNGYTRENLISAGEFTECFNAPGKYCMEFSASAYQDWWRFDLEGLPEDLIRRGMAVHDSTYPHGLRLTIEDYPYAQDGLLIWSAIEDLVTQYVNHYYPKAPVVKNDIELQAWYDESIKIGHADLSSATWWPNLCTPNDLIKILTTIIWTVTGQHAVVNFGQYPYGGYTPARPPFLRRLLPSEQDPDYETFLAKPQEYFLSCIPSFTQAVQNGSVLDVGSAHAPDEEYIGERNDLSSWSDEPQILEAFHKFSMEMKTIEEEIETRNGNPRLKNRCGDGAFPFELLIPGSGSTRGIPNSVTA